MKRPARTWITLVEDVNEYVRDNPSKVRFLSPLGWVCPGTAHAGSTAH